uniref:Uncharacterized protein n=1 Tax=Oryza glumipatula TaxID=40148 RepID=A0A0D9Y5X0_9ORYZ
MTSASSPRQGPGGGGNYMVVEFKPVLGDDGEDDDTMFRLSNAKMAALVFGWVEAGRVAIATAWAHSVRGKKNHLLT